MRVLVVLLVASSLVAGCLGDDAGPEPSAPGDTASDPGASQGASQVDTMGGGASGFLTGANGTLTPVPLVYDGATHFAACAWVTDQGTCHFQEESPTAFREIVEVVGTAQRLTATITWEPVSPLSEQLMVGLLIGDGEGNFQGNESAPPLDGPSPLALDWDLTPFAGRPLMLIVMGFDEVGVEAASVGGELKQPFRVEGSIDCLVPA